MSWKRVPPGFMGTRLFVRVGGTMALMTDGDER